MTKTYETVMLSKLIPYANNPRKNDDAVPAVEASIEQVGYITPIVVDENYEVLAGHTRLKALNAMGTTEAEVLIVEGLTEEEKRKYRLLDNKTGDFAEWDVDLLEVELADLDFGDFDFGFDVEVDDPIEIVEDEAPEPPEEPTTKLGDIYQLGQHRLICGDSTDVSVIDRLMDGVKADMVFTDPPYGINLDTDYSGISANWKGQVPYAKSKKYSKVINDAEHYDPQHIFTDFGYVKEMFLWGGNYYADQLPHLEKSSWIVWDKTGGHTQQVVGSEFELLWSKTKHRQIIIDYKWSGVIGLSQQDLKSRQHPTQKPLQVLTPIIEKYSDGEDIVVDLFGGSGSTLIACEQLNRKCYMCELDERYCDVIVQRWEKFTGQKAVLLNG